MLFITICQEQTLKQTKEIILINLSFLGAVYYKWENISQTVVQNEPAS